MKTSPTTLACVNESPQPILHTGQEQPAVTIPDQPHIGAWAHDIRACCPYPSENVREHVFVYGTLKSGFRNNHVFMRDDSELISRAAYTLHAAYELVGIGSSYAAMLTDGQYHIKGELYAAGPETMARIDLLEGNGVMYTRVRVPVLVLANGLAQDRTVDAWAYVMDRELSEGMCNDKRSATHMPDGPCVVRVIGLTSTQEWVKLSAVSERYH